MDSLLSLQISGVVDANTIINSDIQKYVIITERKCGKLQPKIVPEYLYAVKSEDKLKDGTDVLTIFSFFNPNELMRANGKRFSWKMYDKNEVVNAYKKQLSQVSEEIKRNPKQKKKLVAPSLKNGITAQHVVEHMARQEMLGMIMWHFVKLAMKESTDKRIPETKKLTRAVRELWELNDRKKVLAFGFEERKSIESCFEFYMNEMKQNFQLLFYCVKNQILKQNPDYMYPDLSTYSCIAWLWWQLVEAYAKKMPNMLLNGSNLTINKDVYVLKDCIEAYMGLINVELSTPDILRGMKIAEDTFNEYVVIHNI